MFSTFFNLEIKLGNDVMRTKYDVIDALAKIVDKIEPDSDGTIRDINGNKVGFWNFDDLDEETEEVQI